MAQNKPVWGIVGSEGCFLMVNHWPQFYQLVWVTKMRRSVVRQMEIPPNYHVPVSRHEFSKLSHVQAFGLTPVV